MFAERLTHRVGSRRSSLLVAQADEWAGRVRACLRRRLCRIRGHDLLLHFEPGRVSLRCVDCGWDSSGWMVERPHASFTKNRAGPGEMPGARLEHPIGRG
jgi:hypothetical protein